MRLEWSTHLAIGISVIDDQHIELFTRFNGLLDALTDGDDKEEVANVVQFLEDYTITHFAMEEKVMDRYSYVGSSAHKAQHATFTAEFASLREKLIASGFGRPLAIEMLRQLGEWLLNHVERTDRELGSFLRLAMMRKAA